LGLLSQMLDQPRNFHHRRFIERHSFPATAAGPPKACGITFDPTPKVRARPPTQNSDPLQRQR